MKSYAGIGSRKTPPDVMISMTQAAANLEIMGLKLRSGSADGADIAFEIGVRRSGMKDIYLPWKGFNNSKSSLYHISPEALAMAEEYHPGWHNLSQGVQKLMARNCYQVLGEELDDPSLFILCWTPNGSGSGGTGQAIRIARDFDIPVFDMGCMRLEEIGSSIEFLINQEKRHAFV